MANLADSIATARKAGYSDADIAAYIAKDPSMGPKVKQARQSGYSDGEIVDHLANPSAMEKAKDFVGGLVGGAAKAWAPMADALNPLTYANQTLTNAANVGTAVTSLIKGQPTSPTNLFKTAPFSGPATASAARNAPKAQTIWGERGDTLGGMTTAAAMPGSIPVKLANVVIPAVTTQAAGEVARKAGASPQGEQLARIAGGVVGAGAASVRPGNLFASPSPVERVAQGQNADEVAQRAQNFRDAGIQPTLTDVVDDSGRGLIRAAANRNTPGRQVANDFVAGRVLDLPDRIGQQARTHLSADPRTPDEIRTAIATQRGQNADSAFGAVRGDAVPMAPETAQALRNPLGRDAIAEAARRERDPEVRAALNRLATDALDQPNTPITVGMADRISRTLYGRGQAASRAGDNDLASTFNSLADAVRSPMRAASPGYQSALEGYAADSRLHDAAGVGEQLLSRNTDEFAPVAAGLSAEERPLALAAGRRAIERAAGENIGSAPGVASRIANAPEQQARNVALLGPERANLFQNGMRLEAKAVDNAQQIAPKSGSSTFLNAQNDQTANTIDGVVKAGRAAKNLFSLNLPGMAGDAITWLKARGMSDQDAEQLVRMATDPAQTDQAIRIIQQRLGPRSAQQFLSLRNAALIGAAAGTTAAASPPGQRQ